VHDTDLIAVVLPMLPLAVAPNMKYHKVTHFSPSYFVVFELASMISKSYEDQIIENGRSRIRERTFARGVLRRGMDFPRGFGNRRRGDINGCVGYLS